MSSAIPERKLVAEQVAALYRHASSVFLGSGLSAVILVWLLWDEPVQRRHLTIWLTILCFVLIARWAGMSRYRADPHRMERGAFWGWSFTLGAAASGVVWGYLGFGFFQPNLLFLFPITLVLASQVALSVPTVGMFLPAHIAFNLLAMTPFMVRNYMEVGRLFLGQSFAILTFIIACLIFAYRQQATIRESIRLRFANLVLLGELRQENQRAGEAQLQAEDANSAKTRFLAAASHDLRQPLQAMTLFTHAVKQEAEGGRVPDSMLVNNLQSSCESLGSLLDSLLDLSRVEAGALKPEIRAVPLQALFEHIRGEFTDQAAAKGLCLRVVPTRHMGLSDPVLLERMLRNLVSNALHYTEKGSVLVGCRQRNGHLRIEVRDSGIGIPEEIRAEIFREFYQASNPERDHRKGLGLGLAIVKALAHQLGHEVSVRSIPGRGSIFFVEIPAATEFVATESAQQNLPDRLRGHLLVVIDDEAAIREAMARLLGGWGCSVAAGENAEEVLVQLDGRTPVAILADWRLREGRCGTEEVARIRAHFGQTIPALLITGDTTPDAARDAGFRVIHKPVQGFRLRAELDALLSPA